MDPWLMASVRLLSFISAALIGLRLTTATTVENAFVDNQQLLSAIVPNYSGKSSILYTYRRVRRAPRRDAFRETGSEIWTLPIGYYLDGTHSSVEVDLIKTALDQWQNLTCLRFVELKNASSSVTRYASASDKQVINRPYLRFTAISNEGPDMNCFTRSIGPTKYTGKDRSRGRDEGRRRQQRNRNWNYNRGTVVYLTRKCLSSKAAVGKIVHELGHVLAFFTHEHNRPDRDFFIEVVWSNINPRMTSQFVMEKTEELDTRFPYDYSSIMHYEGQAFSRGGGVAGHPLTTIRARDELFQQTMGQRVRLSFYDAKYVNHIYCQHFCSTPPSAAEGVPPQSQCLHGGYSDPKNCSKCICPDGFGGSLCDSIPWNSLECLAPADRIVVSSSDTQCITSPNSNVMSGTEEVVSYPLFLTCIWHLSAASGCRIDLRFEGRIQLKTRKGSCQHWVEVKLRRNKEQAGPRFCDCAGSTLGLNGTLSSDDNLVVVIFQSHYDVEPNDRLDGFRLCFSLGKCDEDNSTPTETHGVVNENVTEEFQTESTALEGSTNSESHQADEVHSETSRNSAAGMSSSSVRSERTTNTERTDSVESENTTNDLSIPSSNHESLDSLVTESDVDIKFGKSPEIQTSVKNDELHESLELESWTNNELERVRTTADDEKYEPTALTSAVRGGQHVLSRGQDVYGQTMNVQQESLLSNEALAMDVATEIGFGMTEQEGSTINSTLTSHMTTDAFVASHDEGNVQKTFLVSNQSLHNIKAVRSRASGVDDKFISIVISIVCLLKMSRFR